MSNREISHFADNYRQNVWDKVLNLCKLMPGKVQYLVVRNFLSDLTKSLFFEED